MKPIDYAKAAIDTLMYRFTPATLPPAMGFHYHQGVFLRGVEEYCEFTDDLRYSDYIKEYVDIFVTEDGDLKKADRETFDDLQSLNLVFKLYDKSKEEKYMSVLDNILPSFLKWRTNSKGGFWHKIYNPDQLWLDTLYMSGPLAVHYGAVTGKWEYIDLILHQMRLMRDYMTDARSGLLYHAWDESKKSPWADKKTGLSSCFWGRAMGWIPTAIVDMLDFVPADYPHRSEMISMLNDVLSSVCDYQDEENGMWYQIINRGNDRNNWVETSCTCLFSYSIFKAARKGYIDSSFIEKATKGYHGVLKHVSIHNDVLMLSDICIGTGVLNYEEYLKRPTSENDLHGVGAFVMMCCEAEKAGVN